MKSMNANSKNRSAPTSVTVLTEILVASRRPPRTATLVQMACPTMPPTVMPRGFWMAAIAIVVICDRSPHSARNVSVNV